MPSNRAEILVVDDSPVNRLLLRRALEAQDYAGAKWGLAQRLAEEAHHPQRDERADDAPAEAQVAPEVAEQRGRRHRGTSRIGCVAKSVWVKT